jgi:hypothetical protein
MDKIIVLILLICCSNVITYGQKSHAEPAEYAEIFKRPLLVEVLEENEKIVRHLEKNAKKHPGAVEDYRNFIKLYNECLKTAVNKFWVLNKEIEYKTTSQIDSIAHTKFFHYAVLYYSEAAEHFIDYTTGQNLVVPTLNYTRLEHHNKKVDYSIYLPISFLKPHDEYIETDLIFGIQFIQRNIEYIVENNKKMTSAVYARQFGSHCTLLETKTLLLDQEFLSDSVSLNEIKNNYKYKFSLVPAKKINESVENSSEDNAYLVSMPYELNTAGGPGSSTQIICTRLIIDSKNGNILSSLGTAVRENDTKIFLTKDFTICDTCK